MKRVLRLYQQVALAQRRTNPRRRASARVREGRPPVEAAATCGPWASWLWYSRTGGGPWYRPSRRGHPGGGSRPGGCPVHRRDGGPGAGVVGLSPGRTEGPAGGQRAGVRRKDARPVSPLPPHRPGLQSTGHADGQRVIRELQSSAPAGVPGPAPVHVPGRPAGLTEGWRREYNADRPNSGQGNLTPREFAAEQAVKTKPAPPSKLA
jgi:hypothetical protein